MEFPTTQVVAVPSCGVQPVRSYRAAFDDTLSQFDWNLLNSLNPETISATDDSESLERVLYSFVDSKFGAVERQFLPFPLSAKLYQMLQLGVDYLLRKQAKLLRQLAQRDAHIERLEHKVEKAIERLDTLPRTANTEVTVVHSCPVCSRAFKAILYLDKHISKCHPQQVDAWRALREGRPYGVSKAFADLHMDIDHLRACVTRQEFEERREIAVNGPDLGRMPRPRGRRVPAARAGPPGRVTGGVCCQPSALRKEFVGGLGERPLAGSSASSETESG